jgi:hypothetical protein
MSATTTPAPELGSSQVRAPDSPAWHGLTAGEACAQLGVDPRTGLDAGEVERRRE